MTAGPRAVFRLGVPGSTVDYAGKRGRQWLTSVRKPSENLLG
jgi:hypothetical protein